MVPRETVGLRKRKTGVRRRGKQRREQLLKAAYDLLCEQPVEEIAFLDIAQRADIPEGSAYHFFSNKYDVFATLANDLSNKFIDAHTRAFKASQIKNWQDMVDQFVIRGAKVYSDNPPARQLFIGGKTPPDVKLQDRINDHAVAAAMQEAFIQYFHLPTKLKQKNIFYYFIEIVDLIFSLSLLEHGKITKNMIEEAKRAGKGYLSTYLPSTLKKRDKELITNDYYSIKT